MTEAKDKQTENSGTARLLLLYIRRIRNYILLAFCCALIFWAVFSLEGTLPDTFYYALGLVGFFCILVMVWDFLRFRTLLLRIRKLEMTKIPCAEEIPTSRDPIADAYRGLLLAEIHKHEEDHREHEARNESLADYYSMWVHQIKSPIAAMRLILQSTSEKDRRPLSSELFRVEQYVDMALQYIRLESMSTDLHFRCCSIVPLLRQSIRKFAPIFIEKRLPIEIEDMELEAVTDEKWIVVAFDQILSNALKYTSTGRITVRRDPDVESGLIITDTGIGIRSEDLPRVFERGFTGYNGRVDKRATGLGLYLTRKILDRLGHRIRISSDGSTGTSVYLDFTQQPYKNAS